MVSMTRKALIMAGGTGGHVFPALAVATALHEQGVEVYWLGSRHGMEANIVNKAGFNFTSINISGLRGKGILKWLLAPFTILLATISAMGIVLHIKPNVVLGMGGFVTGPGGLAARLLGKPLVVHEQNAIPGMTNVLLSKIANRILQAFPNTFRINSKLFLTGNPVRKDINQLEKPQHRYLAHSGPIRILVVGGSLGAQALNEVVPQAIALLEISQRPSIWHQSGKNKLVQTQQAYAALDGDIQIVEFIEDMDQAYTWADLIICRAGAMTITEICNVGLASILVPYPYAVDDHQSANARYLSQANAAILIQQIELTPQRLADELKQLIAGGREQLLVMANRALDLARPQATAQVVQHCLEVAHG